MTLHKNTNKYAKQFKILNWMFFFNIAEEPTVSFLKRKWAIEESDGIREFILGLHKNIKKGIVFYSIFVGPFVLSFGRIN